jgi:hypothetical protein
VKTRTLLFLLFFLLPFQKPLLHKTLKSFSHAIIPYNLVLPSYFSTKISFFLTDLLLLFLLVHIIYLKEGQWWEFFWSGPSKYLTLLFIIAFFSIGASSTSHYFSMYARFIQIALVTVLFYSIRTTCDSKSITSFAWLLFALSLFESVVALLQYFTQSRIGLAFLGESSRHLFIFHIPNGYRTIFDYLFHIQRTPDLLMRSTGTFPHPNIFGGFQFCAMMATCYLYFIHSIKYKNLLRFGLLLQMLALTVIFSRAAFIALFISLSLYFLFQFRQPEKRLRIKQCAVTLLAATALSFSLFYPPLAARGGFVNYNTVAKGADSERLVYQKIACEMIKERPLLGVGLNNFQIESHRFFPEGRILPSTVHNIYLLFGAETGLLGLTCFLLFLFSILKSSLRCLHAQEGIFLFSLFIGLLFIGVCDFYFICPHGRILFFGIAALLYTQSRVNVDESTCSA